MLVGIVAALIAGVVLNRALRHEIVERTADQLLIQSRMAVDILSGVNGLEGRADEFADRLGREVAARVTIVAADGRVLGDSELDAGGLGRAENHADRPEIIAARGGVTGRAIRRSATLAEEMLYLAVPLDPATPSRGVVRLAVPLTAVARAQARVLPLIIMTSLLSVLVAGCAGWLAARVPARRLQEMTRAAGEIAAGRMGARAHPGGDDEVADLARSLNRMAAQLEERLALLDRERHQLRAMLDAMVEGVLLLDGAGRIIIANPAFGRMFGAAEPLEGRRPLEAARVPGLQEAVEAALESKEPVVREITLSGDPGRIIQASLAAVREGGGTVGAVAVFHDVTELKTLEQVRREFVANVSHELRTPLTAIKGYAETLLGGGLDDRARAAQFVEVIARHAERLRALIEDLLDLAAVEQREARLAMAPVAVADIAGQAEAILRPMAEARELTLVIDVPADLPRVLADRDRLAQVLINLLDNAVKFTPPGGRVEVGARAAGSAVTIAVRDTGVGIPPGEIGRIFERFYRIDRSRDRSEGGTGLGLAIAKHLVLAMNGTIEVESVPNAGATFRVTLPAAPVAPAAS